jgi:hypothetical protein
VKGNTRLPLNLDLIFKKEAEHPPPCFIARAAFLEMVYRRTVNLLAVDQHNQILNWQVDRKTDLNQFSLDKV